MDDKDFNVVSWDFAEITFGVSKGDRLEPQMSREAKKRLLNMTLRKEQAKKKIPLAKGGDPEAARWLMKHFRLKVYTQEEISATRPFLTPPEPESTRPLIYGKGW